MPSAAAQTFGRYAIYAVPDPMQAPWAAWAMTWLEAGQSVPGLDLRAATETPRRYGLHATLKAPFRLTPGCSVTELRAALGGLAAGLPPAGCDGLELARMGRFLALRPIGPETALIDLAAAVVRGLDGYRAPLSQADRDRRAPEQMPPDRRRLFERWGYPNVMEAFRYHLTLTGRLPAAQLDLAQAALQRDLAPLLPHPHRITDLALMGEDADGRFHLIARVPLRGAAQA